MQVLYPMMRVTLLLALLSGFLPMAYAQTNVSGTYNSDVTWNLAGSPYILTADLTVTAGHRLTIEPGVEVRYAGYHELRIQGRLLAEGTPSARIRFDGTGARNALHFHYADVLNSRLAHADIHAGATGIRVTESSSGQQAIFHHLAIDSTALRHTQQSGAVWLVHCTLDSVRVVAENNNIGTGHIKIDSSSIYRCTFQGTNTSTALFSTPLRVEYSTVWESSFRAIGRQIGFSTIGCYADTLLACTFSSVDGEIGLNSSHLAHGRFSNQGAAQGNPFIGNFSETVFMNCDFEGGSLSGNPGYMNLFFQQCLLQNTDPHPLHSEWLTFQTAAVVGPGQGMGIRCDNAVINYSTFQDHDTAAYLSPNNPNFSHSVVYSNFVGSNDYNIVCDGSLGLDARSCYWGSVDSAVVFQHVYDVYDNPSYGEVLVTPWLGGHHAQAPMTVPQGFVATGGTGSHNLFWNPNPEGTLAGYRLHYGGWNGVTFDSVMDFGLVTSATIPDSVYQAGIALTAYNNLFSANHRHDQAQGLESGFAFLNGKPTRVEQPLAALDFSIFPNPAHGKAHLKMDRPEPGTVAIILDMHGRELRRIPVLNAETELPLDGIPAGIYLLELRGGAQRMCRRLLLQ